jgi:hypothetical protein
MFEDEIKMEEKSSNWIPMAMAMGLVVALVGGLVYFIMESKRTVSEAEAQQLAGAVLKAQGPGLVHFHVGQVKPSVDEKPYDPHYKLLAKAGVVTLGKPTDKGINVELTTAGKDLLDQIGAKEEKNPDGTEAYTAPLANRELVKVTKIDMLNPGRANIAYEWKWAPNSLGLDFDINSPEMQSLTNWDRLTLIQKYGAAYYKEGKIKNDSIALVWDDQKKQWKLYQGD